MFDGARDRPELDGLEWHEEARDDGLGVKRVEESGKLRSGGANSRFATKTGSSKRDCSPDEPSFGC